MHVSLQCNLSGQEYRCRGKGKSEQKNNCAETALQVGPNRSGHKNGFPFSSESREHNSGTVGNTIFAYTVRKS